MIGLAVVALVAGGLLLVIRPFEPGPVAQAVEPDKAPLAADGRISEQDLLHDSRSDLYRSPGGAVPAGTPVAVRLRAAAGDLTAVELRVYDAISNTQVIIPMAVGARDGIGGEHGYDYWEATLATTKLPALLYYRFIVHDGSTTRYVEDDAALDGGSGTVLADSADASWELLTYDPSFTTPDWTHGAVVYQIFPDRFANGDPSNDPSPSEQPGAGAERYRYGDVYGNPILAKEWGELPEGYCRAYSGAATPCTEQPLGRDFFGGDLAGITEHLGDLADLGVTAIYLNPIFAAPSNHRYDTSDYLTIDPDLGTQADFDAMVAKAHQLGLKVILDGVFNHTSSDSPFFDRAGRFSEVGACESADSPYADWYTFKAGPPAKCYDGQTYVDWFGFDTLPVLNEVPAVDEYFNGPDGIVRHWLAAGIDGWRLDVANELSHGFLRALRKAAKDENPDAAVIGELWDDAAPWLVGNEVDASMNYRFRRAVIGFINGDTADPDGAISGLTPSQFASTIESIAEDYPPQAFASMLNLVDSHDTARILWTLTPGADNREAKEDPAAMAQGKALLRLVSAIQLTFPGMADIYYGDEVGLTGHDDPDDRRTYPWGSEDTELRDWYATLAKLRGAHEALKTGDLRFLLADDTAGTLAFGRRTDAEAAITVLNLSDAPRTVDISIRGYLPAGTAFDDALDGSTVTASGGSLTVELPAHGVRVLLSAAGSDLAAPVAPTNVTATAGTGSVDLTWNAAPDADRYTVWRSLVSGGGYAALQTTSDLHFTDASARNGVLWHYVVTGEDAAGNRSTRSDEVTARPEVTVADARLDAERVEQPLSATDAGSPVGLLVTVADGASKAEGPTVGVTVQVGFGEAGSDPSGEGWTWAPATYDRDVDGADRFVASLHPETEGEHAVIGRISVSGGASWQYVGRDGISAAPADAQAATLVSLPATDREAPPAPTGLAATSVSTTQVTLGWSAVAADDLLRYQVWRANQAGGPYQMVGTATETAFTDQNVSGGATYFYVVTAQDTSFNQSPNSVEVTASAQQRTVHVTITATVPAYTPPGDTVYIAGDFQGWDPGKTPMQRVDAVTWQITLDFDEGQAVQYKFTRGSWDAVEKDSGCGEIPNRELTVSYGDDGTQAVDGQVAKWRDLDSCG